MRATVPYDWFPWRFRSWYALPDEVPWPADALEGLSAREQRILTERLDLDGGGRRTRKVIGAELGVTPERIHQIETRALDKITPRLGWRPRSPT